MPRQKTRILATGFGPFPGVPHNASSELVETLGFTAQHALPDLDVTTAVLPTEWSHAQTELERRIAAAEPDIILMFGVSSKAMGFVLEQVCYNACDGRPDAADVAPTVTELLVDGPPTCNTRLPVADIAAALEAQGLPVSVSDDPGRYLCNAVMYHALSDANAARLAGFVHIPQTYPDMQGGPLPDEIDASGVATVTSDASRLRFVDALAGSLTILRVTAAHHVPSRKRKG